MLDGLGKLLERLVANRLEAELEARGGLSDRQFGFRRVRSTVDATIKIIDTTREASNGSRRTKKFCLLVSLDVKNAFNALPWRTVRQALRAKHISPPIQRMVEAYLSDRWLQFEDAEGSAHVQVTAGVPQGSVLGPLLWNVAYDGVLELRLPAGVQVVGFADDLAVVSVHTGAAETVRAAEVAIEAVEGWLEGAGLELAPSKTCCMGNKEAQWPSGRPVRDSWRPGGANR